MITEEYTYWDDKYDVETGTFQCPRCLEPKSVAQGGDICHCCDDCWDKHGADLVCAYRYYR